MVPAVGRLMTVRRAPNSLYAKVGYFHVLLDIMRACFIFMYVNMRTYKQQQQLLCVFFLVKKTIAVTKNRCLFEF